MKTRKKSGRGTSPSTSPAGGPTPPLARACTPARTLRSAPEQARNDYETRHRQRLPNIPAVIGRGRGWSDKSIRAWGYAVLAPWHAHGPTPDPRSAGVCSVLGSAVRGCARVRLVGDGRPVGRAGAPVAERRSGRPSGPPWRTTAGRGRERGRNSPGTGTPLPPSPARHAARLFTTIGPPGGRIHCPPSITFTVRRELDENRPRFTFSRCTRLGGA